MSNADIERGGGIAILSSRSIGKKFIARIVCVDQRKSTIRRLESGWCQKCLYWVNNFVYR